MSGGRQWAGVGPPRLVCDHFIDVLSLNHHHHCTEGEQRGDAAILGNRVLKFPETEVDEILYSEKQYFYQHQGGRYVKFIFICTISAPLPRNFNAR